MKTSLLTITVLLVLTTGSLFAGGLKHGILKPDPSRGHMIVNPEKLAPVTPAFADFTDGTDAEAIPGKIPDAIAPATPREADFEEFLFSDGSAAAPGVTAGTLSPQTPSEADFTE